MKKLFCIVLTACLLLTSVAFAADFDYMLSLETFQDNFCMAEGTYGTHHTVILEEGEFSSGPLKDFYCFRYPDTNASLTIFLLPGTDKIVEVVVNSYDRENAQQDPQLRTLIKEVVMGASGYLKDDKIDAVLTLSGAFDYPGREKRDELVINNQKYYWGYSKVLGFYFGVNREN